MRHSSPWRSPAGVAILFTLLIVTALGTVPPVPAAPEAPPGAAGTAVDPGTGPSGETPAAATEPPTATTPSGGDGTPSGGTGTPASGTEKPSGGTGTAQKPPATGAGGSGSSNSVCTVRQGDTLWLVAQRHGTTVDALKAVNNLSGDTIYAGETLRLPGGATAVSSRGGTGTALKTAGFVYGGGVVLHKVAQGETLSQIAARHGTTVEAIRNGNNLRSELIMINQPLFLRPGSPAPASVTVSAGPHGPGGAEMLDWSKARWLFGVDYTATLRDPATGREFRVKRLGGSNHADIEPLTPADTAAIKAMAGGGWTWTPKPVHVIVGGRTLAASMNFMPHQLDTIPGNGMQGHVCLHFRHSTTHVDGLERADHQAAVLRAAGLAGVSLPPGM